MVSSTMLTVGKIGSCYRHPGKVSIDCTALTFFLAGEEVDLCILNSITSQLQCKQVTKTYSRYKLSKLFGVKVEEFIRDEQDHFLTEFIEGIELANNTCDSHTMKSY
jgi:hypothetical protein